jgi:ribosomal protein L7/L12
MAILLGIGAFLIAKSSKQDEHTIGHAGYSPNQKLPTHQVNTQDIDLNTPGIYLISTGKNKIGVIKEIREATGLGLKEAKDIADSAPCCIAISPDSPKATQLIDGLKAIGAEVLLKQ